MSGDLIVNIYTKQTVDAKSDSKAVDGGGKKLTKSAVHLFFWGDGWHDPATSPSAQQLLNGVAAILAGQYQERVAQYGAAPAHLGHALISDLGDKQQPPSPFSLDDSRQIVSELILNNKLPAGDDDITFVFLPPGVATDGNDPGSHTSDEWKDVGLYVKTGTFYHGWIKFGSSLNPDVKPFDLITAAFSHELIESLTDPEGDGIHVQTSTPFEGHEVSDVCHSVDDANGVIVQSYWSQVDKGCVIPTTTPHQMRITCIHKVPRFDASHPIKEVGGVDLTTGIPFKMTLEECLTSIDRGNNFFVLGPDDQLAPVLPRAHNVPWSAHLYRYIETKKDASWVDNLLSLPECG